MEKKFRIEASWSLDGGFWMVECSEIDTGKIIKLNGFEDVDLSGCMRDQGFYVKQLLQDVDMFNEPEIVVVEPED
jgi:hypothetical protein